jgi:hypothetical protein
MITQCTVSVQSMYCIKSETNSAVRNSNYEMMPLTDVPGPHPDFTNSDPDPDPTRPTAMVNKHNL